MGLDNCGHDPPGNAPIDPPPLEDMAPRADDGDTVDSTHHSLAQEQNPQRVAQEPPDRDSDPMLQLSDGEQAVAVGTDALPQQDPPTLGHFNETSNVTVTVREV